MAERAQAQPCSFSRLPDLHEGFCWRVHVATETTALTLHGPEHYYYVNEECLPNDQEGRTRGASRAGTAPPADEYRGDEVPHFTRAADVDAMAGARPRFADARTLAVWGHFGGANLGDELVVGVILDAIRRKRPDDAVLAVSIAPWDTERRHGVHTLPLNPRLGRDPDRPRGTSSGPTQVRLLEKLARRVPGVRRVRASFRTSVRAACELPFIVRTHRQLREIDALVVAGSGQLLDKWQGPWWHPYTTFRWALLARIAGVKMLYPSIGAGPIDHRLSRFMFRKSLEWASFVSVRDRYSADVLRAIGVTRELPVCPDMGWAFEFEAAARGPRRRGESVVVGVNPMSHEDPRYWPQGDAVRYEAYVARLARFVGKLLEAGEHVLLFSSQSRADANVAADVRRLLSEQGLGDHAALESAIEGATGVEDLMRVISRCDYVIAGRFHSVLAPMALGIPTIGLAYHEKTCELLRGVGRPERCFDIDQFDVSDLMAAFLRLRAEDDEDERAALRAAAARQRSAVERQFDELFAKVTEPKRRSGVAAHVRALTWRSRTLVWLTVRMARALLGGTDRNRWRNKDDPGYQTAERNRLIGALIAPGSSVLDVGAGTQVLRRFLPDGCEYQPCDLQPAPGVLVCDLNSGQMPAISHRYDVLVASGVLEFLRDPEAFLRRVHSLCETLLFSYRVRLPSEPRWQRLTSGCVSHLTQAELESMLDRLGYVWERVGAYVHQEARSPHVQPIYRVSLTPSHSSL